MRASQILVIEPDRHQRLLYKWEFEDEGYQVVSCSAPERARRVADQKKTDLVLVDGGSRLSAATESAKELRDMFGDVALVVHTASIWCASDGYPGPADAFLLKSTDLTKLKQTVRSLLPDTAGMN